MDENRKLGRRILRSEKCLMESRTYLPRYNVNHYMCRIRRSIDIRLIF